MSTNSYSQPNGLIEIYLFATKLGEYSAELPAYKADRTNWIFFQDCFLFAVDTTGLSDCFDNGPTGTTSEPTEPILANPIKTA